MIARACEAVGWYRCSQCSTGGVSTPSVLGKCHRMLCQTRISTKGENRPFICWSAL